jgi:hypothetical protein
VRRGVARGEEAKPLTEKHGQWRPEAYEEDTARRQAEIDEAMTDDDLRFIHDVVEALRKRFPMLHIEVDLR